MPTKTASPPNSELIDANDIQPRLQILRNAIVFGRQLETEPARAALLEMIDGIAAVAGIRLGRPEKTHAVSR